MKKANLEFKVGIFVFLALVTLLVLVFKTGDFYMKPGYTARFIFDFVSGVDKGSPVRLAGVNVGEVTGIQIIRNAAGATQAEVTARIDQGISIEEDADVRINTLGLLGEKYVEILPGPGQGRVLKAGEGLMGAGAVSELQLTQQFARVLSQFEATLNSANTFVGDPRIAQRIGSTLENAENLTQRLDQATQQAETLIRQWQSVGEKGSSLMDDMRQWAPWIWRDPESLPS